MAIKNFQVNTKATINKFMHKQLKVTRKFCVTKNYLTRKLGNSAATPSNPYYMNIYKNNSSTNKTNKNCMKYLYYFRFCLKKFSGFQASLCPNTL